MRKRRGKIDDEYDGVLSHGARSAKEATRVADIMQEYEGVKVISVVCTGASWFIFARYKSGKIEPMELRNAVMLIGGSRKA